VGLPKSDSSCGSQVYLSTWEPIPANTNANNTVPANPAAVPWSNVGIPPSFTKWYVKRALVTGNYKGTTDEIIQWAACKWGIDRDLMRAVAVQESDWKMSSVGDYCGTPGEASYGLFQVKNAMCSGEGAWGGYPYTAADTALNADFYAAQLRSCLDGDFQGWLYGGQTISQILAAKGFDNALWGCVGAWFSGSWYDSGAQSYISSVKGHLANRDFLNEGK
jgi:autotransporter family porin